MDQLVGNVKQVNPFQDGRLAKEGVDESVG